ncbi:MAG: hypothetical protein RL189_948 [Pseudomonadota bacterium]|jgi:uncharacterized membrane protein YoaK (UPF0700 family)
MSSAHRSFSEYIVIGTLLACVAGVVNAVGFVAFGGFVTHVSGNATRAAVEYSEAHFLIAGVFLVGIFFFIAGAVTTTILLRGHTIESAKVSYAVPVYVEAALIAGVAWVGSSHVSMGESLEIARIRDAWYLNALTFAMGMQNAIIRPASGTIIRTTHVTGIVTDIGIAIGTVASRAGAEFLQNPKGFLRRPEGLTTWQDIRIRMGSTFKRFHLERFFLHIALLLSFLAGAVVGTFGYLRIGFRVLSGPLFILILLATLELRDWKKRTSLHGHELQEPR